MNYKFITYIKFYQITELNKQVVIKKFNYSSDCYNESDYLKWVQQTELDMSDCSSYDNLYMCSNFHLFQLNSECEDNENYIVGSLISQRSTDCYPTLYSKIQFVSDIVKAYTQNLK